MSQKVKAHEESNVISTNGPTIAGALPQYLLDRTYDKHAKALSTQIKQRRVEKAARFSVPLPRIKGISEADVFKVVQTGKRKSKSWKRGSVWLRTRL